MNAAGQELSPCDLDALKASCTLALQRMDLYREDAKDAQTLTKKDPKG